MKRRCKVSEILGGDTPIYQIIGAGQYSRYRNVSYMDVFGAFDIETTSYIRDGHKSATMYMWQFAIGQTFIYGRRWCEFVQLMHMISDEYGTCDKFRFVVYVHNLSYEFNWMHKYFDWIRVFARVEGEPMRALTSIGIEFRCSYLLSGKSLRALCEDYHLPTQKETLDYSALRFWWTDLDEDTIRYAEADVFAVIEYIKTQVDRCGSIARIPYTRTSYVRQAVSANCYADRNSSRKYKAFIDSCRILGPDNYRALKMAYQGGFTHANAWRVGRVYEHVASYDLTSSYPAVMCSELYPMGVPEFYEELTNHEYLHKIESYAIIADITFYDLQSKTEIDNLLSESKCWELSKDVVVDNGRVDNCSYCTITLTEIDFKLVQEFYTFSRFETKRCYVYTLAYLPKPIIETVLDAYSKKTELKGVKGREMDYLIGKENNNSIYGMMVTDIVQNNVEYDDHKWTTDRPDIIIALEKYHDARRRTTYYPWGVYITAYARNNLLRTMLELGMDYIYSDTDSLKFLNPEQHKQTFDEYNVRILAKLERCFGYYDIPIEKASPVDINGKKHTLGVWDFEGIYERFKAMRAKCYMYQNGEDIRITVAGCNKDGGSEFIKTFKDPFKAFDWGLDIPPEYANRMAARYIDDSTSDEIADLNGVVGTWHEESSVVLLPTSYHLNLVKEFADYLLIFRMGVDIIDQKLYNKNRKSHAKTKGGQKNGKDNQP